MPYFSQARLIAVSCLYFIAGSLQAAPEYVLAGYECDKANDQLILTYDPAADESDVSTKKATQWEPWTLVVAKDEDHIGSLKTVRRKCRLSDGTYEISITPSPGNFNVQGRCGAWITAGAKVTKGTKLIYRIDRFENDCHDYKNPITTKVVIKPRNHPPQVQTISADALNR